MKTIDIDYIRIIVSGYEFVALKGLYTDADNHVTVMGTGTANIEMFNDVDNEVSVLERLLAETEAQKAADCAIIQHKINKLLRVES